MRNNRDFLNTLFRLSERVNVADDIYYTKGRSLDFINKPYQYFAINPLKIHTTRADKNVNVYRNILIEMDEVPLDIQAKVISKLPISPTTIVYSGSKSLHCIWSLKSPAADEDSWRQLALGLMNFIEKNYDVKVDRACCNPSRLSRFPGYKRDNGNIQRLEYIGEKTDTDLLKILLTDYIPSKEEVSRDDKPRLRLVTGGVKYSLTGPVAKILSEGMDMEDGKKMLLFSAARELKGNGVELDATLDLLHECVDLPYHIFLHQIRSGYEY